MIVVLVGDGLYHKVLRRDSSRTLGWHVDEQYFPAGSARFVEEMNLQGNMFNSGHIGGYLAWIMFPERKIFHYNNGATFGDTYRYSGRPDLLAPFAIEYAFIAHQDEFALFPANQWAQVYRDPGAVLVVKRTERHAELIRQFELRYFHPMMTRTQFDEVSRRPGALPRLLDEMAIYLAFREDSRIAAEFTRLAQRDPVSRDRMAMSAYLGRARDRHPAIMR